MPIFHLDRQVSAGLRDNLDPALDEPVALPVVLEGVEGEVTKDTLNPFASFDHVAQAQIHRTLCHQKTEMASASTRARMSL
jgi:hypothetical protein